MTADAPWMGVTPEPPPRPMMCSEIGHDYEPLVDSRNELIAVSCGRCPEKWTVHRT